MKGIVDDGFKSSREVAEISDVIRSIGSSPPLPELFDEAEVLGYDVDDWDLYQSYMQREPRP